MADLVHDSLTIEAILEVTKNKRLITPSSTHRERLRSWQQLHPGTRCFESAHYQHDLTIRGGPRHISRHAWTSGRCFTLPVVVRVSPIFREPWFAQIDQNDDIYEMLRCRCTMWYLVEQVSSQPHLVDGPSASSLAAALSWPQTAMVQYHSLTAAAVGDVR